MATNNLHNFLQRDFILPEDIRWMIPAGAAAIAIGVIFSLPVSFNSQVAHAALAKFWGLQGLVFVALAAFALFSTFRLKQRWPSQFMGFMFAQLLAAPLIELAAELTQGGGWQHVAIRYGAYALIAGTSTTIVAPILQRFGGYRRGW